MNIYLVHLWECVCLLRKNINTFTQTYIYTHIHTSTYTWVHFLIRYFLHLHFQCYPKSPPDPLRPLLPYPPAPPFWPWRSPVLKHIKFARPRGLSSQWWPIRPSSATYAARDMSSGGVLLVHIVPSIWLQTPLAPWVLSLAPPLGALWSIQ